MSRVVLTHEVLAVDAALAAVSHASCGGIDVFVGVVRNENDDKPVVALEYMAYDAMALAEMTRIADEVESKFTGVRVAVHHRLGMLSVGEFAVICVAAAPHRSDAFAACRALIDEVKHRVPIWKREHGPEGAYWVGWKDGRC